MQREREREREGGRTSDNGTPPAVTNSSLNMPFIRNKYLSIQEG